MQVPVLLTRQVLVKVVPPATLVLSGMVTSATNEALLMQSGTLVGRDGSRVGVCATSGVAEVAVAEVSGGGTVNVSARTGASVLDISAVATGLSVTVTVAVSAGACPLQADKTSASRAVTTNSFLIIFILLCYHVASRHCERFLRSNPLF